MECGNFSFSLERGSIVEVFYVDVADIEKLQLGPTHFMANGA